jgi:nucleotide-binding universal stress UspA family protein
MRVVLPFDGSEPAGRAVDYLVALAGRMNAGVIDVHVVNAQDVGAGMGGVLGGDAADTADRLVRTATEHGRSVLAAAVQRLRAAGLTVRDSVLIGEPAVVIADYAERERADAVVMGTRGLGRIGGLVLGSVASKLIHLLKVPVTLVK